MNEQDFSGVGTKIRDALAACGATGRLTGIDPHETTVLFTFETEQTFDWVETGRVMTSMARLLRRGPFTVRGEGHRLAVEMGKSLVADLDGPEGDVFARAPWRIPRLTKTIFGTESEEGWGDNPLATFVLVGDELTASFYDPGWESYIREKGINGSGGSRALLKDGKAFFDALDDAFAGSTYLWVA